MNQQRLLQSLAGADGAANQPPTEADILLLQTPSREQLQARTRQFLSLLRQQDACGREDGGPWKEAGDRTVVHLPDGARATVYHASGALRYASGLAPAEHPFERDIGREALARLVDERAHALALADWAGQDKELRFERLFRTLGSGADREGRQAAPTLFRATGAWRQFVKGLPVLGGASAALRLAGDGSLDSLSIQARQADGEVLERASIIEAEAGARQILWQLSALLGQRDIPEGLVESASMRLGYLDLGKRKVQRVLAPAYVAQIVLKHRSTRQAYVLAARATQQPYLELPVYGGGAVPTRGRSGGGHCAPPADGQ